jgi:hypothetical protein
MKIKKYINEKNTLECLGNLRRRVDKDQNIQD